MLDQVLAKTNGKLRQLACKLVKRCASASVFPCMFFARPVRSKQTEAEPKPLLRFSSEGRFRDSGCIDSRSAPEKGHRLLN